MRLTSSGETRKIFQKIYQKKVGNTDPTEKEDSGKVFDKLKIVELRPSVFRAHTKYVVTFLGYGRYVKKTDVDQDAAKRIHQWATKVGIHVISEPPETWEKDSALPSLADIDYAVDLNMRNYQTRHRRP